MARGLLGAHDAAVEAVTDASKPSQQGSQLLAQKFAREKERERERQAQREAARRAAAQRLLDDPVAATNALAKRGEFKPPSRDQRVKAVKAIREHFRGSEEHVRALKVLILVVVVVRRAS